MVERTKWQVKSNGLNFIIFDPGDEFRTIAECGRKEDAQLICDMKYDAITTVDRMKAYADTMTEELKNKILTKIETEILDTEGAMVFALDAAEWTRYRILEGHKAGLLWVKKRIDEGI